MRLVQGDKITLILDNDFKSGELYTVELGVH